MIRDFEVADVEEIVEILKLNDQYGFPEVDGSEAMKRVKAFGDASTKYLSGPHAWTI